MKRHISPILFFGLLLIIACEGEKTKRHHGQGNVVAQHSNYFIVSPKSSNSYYVNDEVSIEFGMNEGAISWDSARVLTDGSLVASLSRTDSIFLWNTEGSQVGSHQLVIEIFAGGKSERLSQSMVLFSDITPADYTYRVINSFKHDPQAFTQGLVYSDGSFYEGTGQKGASELRKVELETGKVLQTKKLSSNLFGEGLALYNGHLYQLTWQSGVCIVYNKSTFEEITTFNYLNQGWGLTNDSSQLIMSDGTNKLRFLDPGSFHVKKELQVYDNKGAVGFINELEWVNGKIYANIWQKDYIAIINPETGKLEGKINLHGILPPGPSKPDVLNGIAYDRAGKRLFITGKYWHSLFEIEVVAKKTTSS